MGNIGYLNTEHTQKLAVMHCTAGTTWLTATQSSQNKDNFGRPKFKSQLVTVFPCFIDLIKINCSLQQGTSKHPKDIHQLSPYNL